MPWQRQGPECWQRDLILIVEKHVTTERKRKRSEEWESCGYLELYFPEEIVSRTYITISELFSSIPQELNPMLVLLLVHANELP
jgi:hypothetical protein